MIEINLLPESLRKKKRFYFKPEIDIGNVNFLMGGFIIAGILALVFIIPFVGLSIRKRQSLNLLKKEKLIAPQNLQAQAVQKELSILKAKMAALNEITERRFLWTKKLNELSDLVLPGIWFTRIYRDSSDKLIIEASVISKEEEAMASVGKFMKDMREHASFFKDFTNMKLESLQRKNLDERDVVDFKIVLYF